MNIDSSSILSLLSSDKSLEKLQQTIQLDNSINQPFADTFLEKIKQINSLNNSDYLAENFTLKSTEETDKLHELADWLNEKSTTLGFSSLFGKDLPKGNKLENDIDLENTLESLANVMLALQEVKFNSDEIQTKLTSLIEKVETLKPSAPEQSDLAEKLSPLVQELQEIKKDISKNLENNIASHVQEIDMEVEDISTKLTHDDRVIGTNHPNTEEKLVVIEKSEFNPSKISSLTEERVIPTKVQNEKIITTKQPVEGSSDSLINNISHISNQQLQEKNLFLSDKLATRIDKAAASLKQIEDTLSEDIALVDLESQIELLMTDVNSIREAINQNSPITSDESRLNKDLTNQYGKTETKDEALQRENQIKEIATTLTTALNQEKVIVESQLVEQLFQEEKPEIKKELFSLKQMAEERALSFSTKGQTDMLLHQDNSFPKFVLDKPVISTIQNEKVEFTETDGLNQNHEKGTIKFINDFSNFNKSILLENKAEIPPMNKHFAHPEWNKEFGERVIWMHKQSTPSAELRLNPKHLGPITIKLDVTQDQVTVAFTAQHAAVKEAIDAAIPKLREMFSAQQLNLGDVNVSQENLDQRHSRGYSQMWSEQGKSEDQDAESNTEKEQTNSALEIVDEIESGRAIASNGLLSIFA